MTWSLDKALLSALKFSDDNHKTPCMKLDYLIGPQTTIPKKGPFYDHYKVRAFSLNQKKHMIGK